MTLQTTSFTILGAGLMGRLLAVALARQGHAVSIYDNGGPLAEHSAASVAGGMIAPLAESAITEHGVVRMGRHSLTRWPELLGQLSAPVYFQQEGTLIVWHRQDAQEAARLRQQLDKTRTVVTELPAMQVLDSASMAQVEPALAQRFAQGMYLPGEGQLDNRQLLAALAQEMERLGVQTHWNSPKDPADFPADHAGWLLDCRGLGARKQWPGLRGVRGEVARIHAPDVTLQRPTRLVHPRYPIYIAPKQDHVFIIGATEIESEDLSPPSVAPPPARPRAGHPPAPASPPTRQTAPPQLEINGMSRHGYMVAPAMLDVAREVLGTGGSDLAGRFDLSLQLL